MSNHVRIAYCHRTLLTDDGAPEPKRHDYGLLISDDVDEYFHPMAESFDAFHAIVPHPVVSLPVIMNVEDQTVYDLIGQIETQRGVIIQGSWYALDALLRALDLQPSGPDEHDEALQFLPGPYVRAWLARHGMPDTLLADLESSVRQDLITDGHRDNVVCEESGIDLLFAQ